MKEKGIITPIIIIIIISHIVFFIQFEKKSMIFSIHADNTSKNFDENNVQPFRSKLEQIDNFYKQHFGLRDQLFSYSNFMLMHGLKSNLVSDVIVGGLDQSFFFNTDNRDVLFYDDKKTKLDNKKFKNKIDKCIDLADKVNAELFIFNFPEPYTVYEEYLPKNWQMAKGPRPTKTDLKIDYIEDNFPNLNFRDLTPIIQRKAKKELMYFRNGTHWNELGAYYAYEKIINSINSKLKNIKLKKSKIEDLYWIKNPIELKALNNELEDQFYYEDLESQVYFESGVLKGLGIKKVLVKDSIPIISLPEKNYTLDSIKHGRLITYSKYSSNNSNKLKAMVFHDSYFEPIKKFLTPNFSEVEYRYSKVSKKAILDFKPDIIIIAHVERLIESI